MPRAITTELIDGVKEMVADLTTGWARTLPDSSTPTSGWK